tara:strand:- start:2144 stop:3112 length:969 start_codon:yes stop_codon:yes gene_type:complete
MLTDQPRRTAARLPWILTGVCVVAVCLTFATVAAQPSPDRLNPLVAKLAGGDRAFGVSTYDLSLENARSLARSNLDYVYVDMEHGPMDFAALQEFLLGLTDRAAVAERGSVAQSLTPLARLAPYGRESPQWAVKQALDIGVMGLIFPAIDTPDQALRAVQSMRYPQRRDAPYPDPPGQRGSGPTAAAWFWGLSTGDYVRYADTWPLNPAGELVAIMMIESTEAVRNVEAIAEVPGVAGFYLGPSDLSNSLGLPRDDPRVEAAIQTVVDACQGHGIACGITASAADMPRRIEQGFTILGGGRAGGGLPTAVDAAVAAGRAVPD